MHDHAQLLQASAVAAARHKIIKKSYPALKPYLVFASPLGQVDLTDDAAQILRVFPVMVVNSPEKTRALAIISAMKKADLRGDDKGDAAAKRQAELTAVAAKLRYDGDTNIEVRLGCLVYNVIRELKKDPLIDRELTMQSDASIRIVMGTIRDLAVAGT